MNKIVSTLVERLVERFIALLAGMVSSRIEGIHAVSKAEQQSELEDLARQYEAVGKIEVATELRRRVGSLNSTNLASEGLEIIVNLSDETRNLPCSTSGKVKADIQGLPDFGQAAPAPKAKRPRVSKSQQSNDMGDLL